MIHQISRNNMVAMLPSSKSSSDSLARLHARKPAGSSRVISPLFYGYQITASSYCVRVVVFMGRHTFVNQGN